MRKHQKESHSLVDLAQLFMQMHSVELRTNKAMLLATLEKDDSGLTVYEFMAYYQSITKQKVSYSCASSNLRTLVKEKLVSAVRDGRCNTYSLTPAGHAVLNKLNSAF